CFERLRREYRQPHLPPASSGIRHSFPGLLDPDPRREPVYGTAPLFPPLLLPPHAPLARFRGHLAFPQLLPDHFSWGTLLPPLPDAQVTCIQVITRANKKGK